MWKKHWFLCQGPVLGASCRRKMLTCDLRGMLKSGSMEGPSSLIAHQPSGDVGCISCSQEFPSRSQGPQCARPLRQHIGGAEARGSEAPPEVVELIWWSWYGYGGSSSRHKWICLRLERRLTVHSGFPSRIPAPLGLDAMVQTSPGESLSCSTTSHCPTMARQSMVPRYNIPSRRASSGAPCQEEPSVPSRELNISPPTRTLETVGLASEGAIRPLYQELLSKRFVVQQVGPHRTHSSDFILWTWTLPQLPKCSRPSAAH